MENVSKRHLLLVLPAVWPSRFLCLRWCQCSERCKGGPTHLAVWQVSAHTWGCDCYHSNDRRVGSAFWASGWEKSSAESNGIETDLCFVGHKLSFCVCLCGSHHFDTLPTTKHLILLPLWDQVTGDLRFGLLLLLLFCLPLSSFRLFLRFSLCSLSLLLQLKLKVLQVSFGTLVLWVWNRKIQKPTDIILVITNSDGWSNVI